MGGRARPRRGGTKKRCPPGTKSCSRMAKSAHPALNHFNFTGFRRGSSPPPRTSERHDFPTLSFLSPRVGIKPGTSRDASRPGGPSLDAARSCWTDVSSNALIAESCPGTSARLQPVDVDSRRERRRARWSSLILRLPHHRDRAGRSSRYAFGSRAHSAMASPHCPSMPRFRFSSPGSGPNQTV